MKLRSIKAEAAACRKAWAAMPDATAAVHLHHEAAAEALSEPIESRIAYILASKPEHEQALRLRLMRPVTAPAWAEYRRVTAPAWAEYQRVRASVWSEYQRVEDLAWSEYQRVAALALAEYQRVRALAWSEYQRVEDLAHATTCPTPDCPWDGKTIFGAE